MKANWLYTSTLQCQTPILVHSGGSSSSKTYSIIQALFTIASTKANQVITIVGQDIPNLKKGAIRDSAQIVLTNPFFQQQIESFNRTDHLYRFVTGSIIEFTSYDTEIDARSGKRTHCFINEANGISYDIFEQLRIRTSKLFIIDFNPSASFWAHDKLLGRDDVTWINSTFRDNAFINDSVRQAILSYEPTPDNIKRGTANEYRWKVYGLGEVGRLEGLVFSDFKIATSYPDEYKWRTYGMDFGYTNDPTTLIEIRYAQGNLYMRQHIYETGLTNLDIADKLEQLEIDRDEKIIADSAEPKSIAELRRMGWNVKPAVKGTDSIMNGIDSLKRYPIYIDARSKDLIAEFSSYTWAKDRNGNSLNKPIDQYNHGIDAIRYAVSLQVNKPQREFDIFYA
jgi:phage terminase large subunit